MSHPDLERAMASVAAAAPFAAADPARPIFHFSPPAYWMNDPNGVIFDDGWYQLFYQHNPYGDAWGQIHWGHARSRDLVHWEHLPIALWPSHEANEQHCFSGCAAINGRGERLLFYTSVQEQAGQRLPNEQWAAIGDPEWRTWRKHPANPMLKLASHGGPPFEGDWRDPFIFAEAGRTFLVLGGCYGDTAAVALYEAGDASLTQWVYRNLLYSQPRSAARFLECPNFVRIGDRWLLLTSPYRPVEYVTGHFDIETLRFAPAQSGVLDPGHGATPNYYATNILFDPDADNSRRCILLGWVRGFPAQRGWNGCLALPRVLTIGDDGHPRQSPAPALQTLRGQAELVTPQSLADGTPVQPTLRGNTVELQLRLSFGSAQSVTLQWGSAASATAIVQVDTQGLTVAGTNVDWPSGSKELIDLHIFLDRSVLEVFADGGRIAVTRVIEPPPADARLTIRAEGGAAQLDEFSMWSMGSQ